VTVPYGGPLKAYVNRRVHTDQLNLYDYEYVVQGLWSVENTGDWDTPKITHVLASLTQGSSSPALLLLLQ
jgi:hypothetical protein